MRPVLVACLAGLLSPAVVAAQTSNEQYQAALQAFRGSIVKDGDYMVGYPAVIFEDVAGRWYDRGYYREAVAAEDIAYACTRLRFDIAAPDPYTLTFAQEQRRTDAYVTTYTVRFGNSFTKTVDIQRYLEVTALDRMAPSYFVAQSIAAATGIVTIDRPSADILVLAEEGRPPIILARCPPR
jgi:hypothetical protein